MNGLLQFRGILSSFRQYARNAKRNLKLSLLNHISERLGRQARPALARVPVHNRRSRFPRIEHFKAREYHTIGPFRFYCPARAMCHKFATMRYFSTIQTRNVRPYLFSSNYAYYCSNKLTAYRAFSSAAASFFSRDRGKIPQFSFWKSKFNDSVQEDLRKRVTQNLRKRFVHSQSLNIKPVDVIRNSFINRLKSPRHRPLGPPSFIFPQPSLEISLRDVASSMTSSLPSFTVLTRAFHSTPETGSYVDFDMTPNLTVPPVTQLSTEIVDRVVDDIERHIDELRAMADNIRKLSSLGELPISIEDRAIRVYFPNCEPEQVNSLLNEAEVTQGVIRSHNDSNIVSPIDSSSESSYYMNTETESVSTSSGFYYQDMESISRRNSLSSAGSLDIGRIRGFSEHSMTSPPPLTTTTPTYDTFSEGYTFLS
ncbi:uncharacterized protein SAPINGB_P004824 [Magnusiomyces paraingens]|uniref:Stationary phase protein 5 n=1 Tax=Magnusiomyces paraingens TaxID=2606893 RepID=A0A5E8BXB5_9ASCO|nr:uncharacterized protein SAPINGB_P004824 [Saprochaete ingens]VVT56113.1 unnamed protein product [Saprochaete ingens]